MIANLRFATTLGLSSAVKEMKILSEKIKSLKIIIFIESDSSAGQDDLVALNT
jgi:hypothetical protein